MRPGTRVVLAEDLALLRDGLVRLLEASGFDVVQVVTDGPSLQEALLLHEQDIDVVDVRLQPMFTDEGSRASIAARKRLPGLPIRVLSQYVEQVYARELLSDGAGAVGYLLKDRVFDVDDFVVAIRQVADGGRAGSGRRRPVAHPPPRTVARSTGSPLASRTCSR